MKVTHGQWLYGNAHVYDPVSDTTTTQQKEEIQHEIEKKQELGEEGPMTKGHHSIEVNLEDMETTSGKRQEY